MESTKRIPKGQLKGIIKTVNGNSPDINGELAIDKDALGLENVDNTSDANKPISSATQTALNAKENTIVAGTTSQYYRGDKSWQTLNKNAVGLNNVDNTSDASKPVSTATQTALNGKENTIPTGTTAQYIRGNKTLATLDKSAVGLGNVDNTSDANKPISSATQTALDAKQNTLVSGTNIKTVNGNSLLGSGDIVISGGGSSGGGGGFHIPTKPQSEFYYSNDRSFSSQSAVGLISGRMRLHPFIPINSLSIDTILFNTTTAGTSGATLKFAIYSDLDGKPSSKLFESSDIDVASTGVKSSATAFTFNAGTTYWLSFLTTVSCSITSLNHTDSLIIGVINPISSITSKYNCYFSASSTFPSTLSLNETNLEYSLVPRVFFKAV